MFDRLESLVENIKTKRQKLAQDIAKIRTANAIQKFTVAPISLDLSVCAVDSGLLSQRMHGTDIVIVKAVGVCFVYQNSILVKFSHFPKRFNRPEIEIKSALDEHEANVFRSLFRLKKELSCALDLLEKNKPRLMLIDGSLLPVPSDRPAENSQLYPEYLETVKLYKKLYDQCEKDRCILYGVIKDSRSTKIAKTLSLDCADTVFCQTFLNKGERTSHFSYSEEKTKELNKILAPLADKIKFFYIKSGSNDLPLRIEFIDNTDNIEPEIDKIASMIYSLSSISNNFAYPAILVEADMCAILDQKDIVTIENVLQTLDVNPLRRNSRPFR